jgi:hypothetical protein
MAAQVHTDILDNGLASLKSGASIIHICSQEPTTFAQATTVYDGTANKYRLGIKNFGAGAVFPSAIAAGSPNGRQLATAAVTDGTIDAIGGSAVSATWWAIVDGTRLLATGTLAAAQQVTANNAFTLGSFTIRLPNQ